MKSVHYHAARKGSRGRRAAKNLNEKKVMLAQIASMNPEHQAKFKPRWRTQQKEEA